MEYFATLNQFYESTNNNILIAIRHYDVLAMIAMVLFITCFALVAGLTLNLCRWLNNIERNKIYDRWSE